MGPMGESDAQHFLGRGHFQVQRLVNLGHDPVDVPICDVPPILAQVRGDSIGTCPGGSMSGSNRIGMWSAARGPDRRDMIDVDAEAQASCHQQFTLDKTSKAKPFPSQGSP